MIDEGRHPGRFQTQHHDEGDRAHGADVASLHDGERPLAIPSGAETVGSVGESVEVHAAGEQSGDSHSEEPDDERTELREIGGPHREADAHRHRESRHRCERHGDACCGTGGVDLPDRNDAQGAHGQSQTREEASHQRLPKP